MTPAPDNPVLVEVYRGDYVESQHRGSVVAVDAGGQTVFSTGQAAAPVYPRSALKFFQAIPLVESGAADQFNLTPAEIALACASHNAEEFHTRTVTEWLRRLGHDHGDLECGPDWPMSDAAARQLAAHGEQPTRAHHNCSGKHAGMLTVAKQMNVAARGYSDYRHPTQQAWMQTLSELIDLDIFSLPWECDGCGLPAIRMPLNQLARAFACYAEPESKTKTGAAGIINKRMGGLSSRRAAALTRIRDCIIAHPQMIAGTDRCCTDVISTTKGRVLIKAGAEGVCGGVIPRLGIGFALKIDDGAARAREVAVGALLQKLNALTPAEQTQLENHFQPAVRNSQGRVTGRIAAAVNW